MDPHHIQPFVVPHLGLWLAASVNCTNSTSSTTCPGWRACLLMMVYLTRKLLYLTIHLIVPSRISRLWGWALLWPNWISRMPFGTFLLAKGIGISLALFGQISFIIYSSLPLDSRLPLTSLISLLKCYIGSYNITYPLNFVTTIIVRPLQMVH